MGLVPGRQPDCQRVLRLLDDAAAGTSGVLVVTGEPGIGKSTLLAFAEDEARRRGVRVLRARGVEAESELPYAGLAELLEPVLPLLDGIPAPQSAALAGALALAPPVRGDRFAVAAATLSLLGTAAEAGPVLCVVDDAQWLDPSSVEAVSFAARRLRAEGVVVLLGVRESADDARGLRGLPVLRLAALSEEASLDLLVRAHGDALAPATRQALLRSAAGNPLGLLELPRGLTDDQRTGREPVAGPLPVGPALEQAFRGRVEELPPAAMQALLVVAASDLGAVEAIAPALALCGLSLADLEPCEAQGLVTWQPEGVAFRHPLMRSAVYQGAAPPARRRAHRALADALDGAEVPQAGERRVWHLVAASTGPDDEVAAAVERAARSAAARGSFATASTLFDRAARLTRQPDRRAALLLAAGLAAIPAGHVDEAVRLLDAALPLSTGTVQRARVEHQRYQLQLWSSAPLLARDRLFALARQVEGEEPGLAAEMVLSASQASVVVYDHAAVSYGAAWAADLAHGDRRRRLAAHVLEAFGHAQAGRCAEALRVLHGCREALEQEDPLATEQLVLQAGVCFLALERYAEARGLLERAVASARAANAAGSLAMQLPWLTTLHLLEGQWDAALAEAHDALRLIEATGWVTYRPTGLSILARVEAGMGRADCRVHARDAIDAARAIGATAVAAHAHAALGLEALGRGEHREAAAHLEDGLRVAGEGAAPLLRVQLLPDLVEACVGAGDADRAASVLEELDRTARETCRDSALALAARCRALVGVGDPEEQLRFALELHDRGTPPFDRARTQLTLGRLLRRQKRRAEARDLLLQARETFVRLGAPRWAERAELDVVASGGRRKSPQVAVTEHLTPQELQVALTVARGMSNAETAGALFLSVKTVEFHLSNVYRKLGVRSRTQLANRLAAGAQAWVPGQSAPRGSDVPLPA